jgi:small subunit ribosomal protein S17
MATKEKIGIVASNKMNKTIIIIVEDRYAHPLYTKTLKKTKRFMAHDELNQCSIGDKVIIEESKPLSRKKRWTVKQILNKTKISN